MKRPRSFFKSLQWQLTLSFLIAETLIIATILLLIYQLPHITGQDIHLIPWSQQLFLAIVLAALLGLLPIILFVLLYFYLRRFTRRIHQLTMAANSWSKGNFSVAVQDDTDDDLGRLTRNLNGMTQQLKKMIEIQQELASSNERNRLA